MVGFNSTVVLPTNFQADWVPNCQAWYRGDKVVLDNAGNISQWTDLTGNSNHATQTTSISRPYWNASHPSFHVSPTVNFNSTANSILNHPFGADTSNFTVWMVVRCAVGSDSQQALWTNSVVGIIGLTGLNTNWGFYANGLSFSTQAITGAVRSCTFVCNTTSASNGIVMYTDGTQDFATGSGNFNATPGTIGSYKTMSTFALEGDIAEIGYWQRQLSQAEVAKLEAYAKAKYEPASFVPTVIPPNLWLRADNTISYINPNWANTLSVGIDGNNLTGNGSGWSTSGANSSHFLTGNGTMSFSTASNNGYCFCGLSTSANNAGNYTTIQFAIYLDAGALAVWENGTDVADVGTYVPGDTFAVTVTGTTVTYYHNGSLVYTSSQTATFPLYGAASFYDTFGTITDLQFAGNTLNDLSGAGYNFTYQMGSGGTSTISTLNDADTLLLTYGGSYSAPAVALSKLILTGTAMTTFYVFNYTGSIVANPGTEYAEAGII